MSGALTVTQFLTTLSSDYSLVVSNQGGVSRYHLLYVGGDDALPSLLFTLNSNSGLLRPGPMIGTRHYGVINQAIKALIQDRSFETWIYFTNQFFMDDRLMAGLNLTGEIRVTNSRNGSVNTMQVIGYDHAKSAIAAATDVESIKINLVHVSGS